MNETPADSYLILSLLRHCIEIYYYEGWNFNSDNYLFTSKGLKPL